MKSWTVVLLITFLMGEAFAHGKTFMVCDISLSDSMPPTEKFISFLGVLLNEAVITSEYLKTLINDIDQGKMPTTPFLEPYTKSEERIYADLFTEHLHNRQIDLKPVKEWAQDYINLQATIKKNKITAIQSTKDAYVKMTFHKVSKSPVIKKERRIGHYRKTDHGTVDYDFEMMSTEVTQKMWLDIMGDLPNNLKYHHEDLPITNITWWSAIEFSNRFSRMQGLTPAYDLSEILFEGNAALGTYKPVFMQQAANLFIRRKLRQGIERHAIGYRLPTTAEQEFVTSDRDRSEGRFFTGINKSNISTVAWSSENSGHRIQLVGQLDPLRIDGKNFYDLFGNVFELSNDWVYNDQLGTLFHPFYYYRWMQGGDYESGFENMEVRSSIKISSIEGKKWTGFRLVRSLDE